MSLRDLIETGDIGSLFTNELKDAGILSSADIANKLGSTLGTDINLPAVAKAFGYGAAKGATDLPIAATELASNLGSQGPGAYPVFAPPSRYQKFPRPFNEGYEQAIEEGGGYAQAAGVAGGLTGSLGLGMTPVGRILYLSKLDEKVTKTADQLFANANVGKNLLSNSLKLISRTGARAGAVGGVNIAADTPYNLSESTNENGEVDFDKFAELEKQSALWGLVIGGGITLADPGVRKSIGELGSDVGKLFKSDKEAAAKLLEAGMQQSQAAIKKADLEMQKALNFEQEIKQQKTQEFEQKVKQIESEELVKDEQLIQNKDLAMSLLDSDVEQQNLLKEFSKKSGQTKKIDIGEDIGKPKKGRGQAIDYAIQPTISAANDMSPVMGTDLVQYAWNKEKLSQKYLPKLDDAERIAKKVFKNPEEFQTLSEALQNSDMKTLNQMYKIADDRGYPDLQETLRPLYKSLSEVRDLKQAATGIELSRLENYWPRVVDYPGFFKSKRNAKIQEQMDLVIAEKKELGQTLSKKEMKDLKKKVEKQFDTQEEVFKTNVDKAIQAKEKSLNRQLSFEEVNDIKSKLFNIPRLGPARSKFDKKRIRETIEEDIRPFMSNAFDSAREYFQRESRDIATAKFFRNADRISGEDIAVKINQIKRDKDVDIFKARKEALVGQGFDDSVAEAMTEDWIKQRAVSELKREKATYTTYEAYVDNLVSRGEIDSQNKKQAVKLLENVFDNMNKPMSKAARVFRDSAFFTLMSQLDVAAIQLADYGTSVARHDGMSALEHVKSIGEALSGSSKIPLKELGIEKRLLEFGDPNNKAAFMKEVLGKPLSTLDAFMKQANTNTSYKGYSKIAKKLMKDLPPEALEGLVKTGDGKPILRALEDISPQYKMLFREHMRNMEPVRFKQLLEDLNEGKITDVTREFLFNDLSNTQPIRDIDMPQGYMENKLIGFMPGVAVDSRLLYTLKSFGIKRLDMWRKEVIRDFANAKTGKQRTEAAKRLAAYAAYMGSFEVGIRTAREVARGNEPGEDFTVKDLAVDFMLNQVGFDKFSTQRILENPANIALKAAPPLNLPADAFSDIAHMEQIATEGRIPKLIRDIPFLGRFLYGKAKKGGDLFGGSQEIY